MKTTKEKEAELEGKRYKIISSAINRRREEGESIPYDMEIDLHHAWMVTMKTLRKN